MKPWWDEPMLVIDVETTGFGKSDRICQLGATHMQNRNLVRKYGQLVNPGRPIENSHIHNITDEMVADKASFQDFAPSIIEFLEDCDLAGFNIARFDVPFLQFELHRAHLSLDLSRIRLVDSQIIYHKNEPRNLSAAYRYYCEGEHIDAHDAMGDVRVTLEILDAQLKKYNSIPKSADGLHKYCLPRDSRNVTTDRKFYWKEGEATLSFGKHKGKSLRWLVENERDYLMWMQNGDFSDETKRLIEDAFLGTFPSKDKNKAG